MTYYYGVVTPSWSRTFQTMRGPFPSKDAAVAAYQAETNTNDMPSILLEETSA